MAVVAVVGRIRGGVRVRIGRGCRVLVFSWGASLRSRGRAEALVKYGLLFSFLGVLLASGEEGRPQVRLNDRQYETLRDVAAVLSVDGRLEA